uniref:Uncharacterized protein n=1 Tax=Octopus bimaculoides TaxID=37653 RepID=A0A0L8GZY4_OCTBM
MKSFKFVALLELLLTYFLSVQTIVGADSSEEVRTRLTGRYANRNVYRFGGRTSEESLESFISSSEESNESRYKLAYWECEISPMKNIVSLRQFPLRMRPHLKYFGNMKNEDYFLICPRVLSDFDIVLKFKDLLRVSEDTLRNMYSTKYYPQKFRPVYVTIIQGMYVYWLHKSIPATGITSTIKPLTPKSRDGAPKGRAGT